MFKLGQWLRYVDDLEGARASLAEAEHEATEEGDESSLANILLNRLVVETWAGKSREAAELTEQMSDAFEQLGVEREGIDPWRAYLDAHAGRLEAVRGAPARPREPIVAMIWNRCRGLAELAAGDCESADRHLADAMVELDRVDFREPAIWRVEATRSRRPSRSATSIAPSGSRSASRSAPRGRDPVGPRRVRPLPGPGARRPGRARPRRRGAGASGRRTERSPVPFERARTSSSRDRSSVV